MYFGFFMTAEKEQLFHKDLYYNWFDQVYYLHLCFIMLM
jgi:hypothetical protein